MKKSRLFFAICYFIFSVLSINAQTWQWATIEAGASGPGTSVAKDNAGNVFLAGFIIGPATFGATTYTYSSPNMTNGLFVLKYDPSGNLLWTYVIGINYNPNFSNIDIDTDNAGNVYLSCRFLGSLVVGNYTLFSAGSTDIAVMKISNAGALIWAESFGGTGSEFPCSITTDASGNSVVSGTYDSPTLTFSTTTLTGTLNSTVNNGFVVKIDANGNPLWANKIASPALQLEQTAAVDANSNVYVTGGFGNQIAAGALTLASAGGTDVYVAKYSSTGTLLWLVRTGNIGNERSKRINSDPLGNVYISGDINGILCAIGNNTYTNIGGPQDGFVAKLDNNGNFLWSYRIGSSATDQGHNLAPTANGVFLACMTQATLITVGAQTYTFSTNYDGLLIAQFNATGSLVNVFPLDGGGFTADLCLDNCALYVGGGLTTPSVNFGNIVLTHATGISPFIARLQLAVGEPTINISGTYSICSGANATLQATGANSYLWSNGASSNSIVVSPATTSVYIVTGTSSSLACAASKAQTVVVVPLPTVNVVSSATRICEGETLTLTASGADTYSWSTGALTPSLLLSPSSTTGYTIVGSNALCNATSTATLNVVVNAVPLVFALSSTSIACKNSLVQLWAQGADTYTWSNGSNLSLISVSPLVATLYTVTGTSSLTACSGTASAQVFVDDCTSLREINSEAVQFSVFPNPSANDINIYSTHECDVMLTTILGEKIITLHINANETRRLSLSAYGAGVFYLQCLQTNEVRKLIIDPGF